MYFWTEAPLKLYDSFLISPMYCYLNFCSSCCHLYYCFVSDLTKKPNFDSFFLSTTFQKLPISLSFPFTVHDLYLWSSKITCWNFQFCFDLFIFSQRSDFVSFNLYFCFNKPILFCFYAHYQSRSTFHNN